MHKTYENPSGQDNGLAHSRKTAWTIAAILLITILPFLFIGPWMEATIEGFFTGESQNALGNTEQLQKSVWGIEREFLEQNSFAGSAAIIALLIADILLPIPSSFVCTFSGAWFGWLLGGLVNWIGLCLSAYIGFRMARFVAGRHAGTSKSEGQGETDSNSEERNNIGPWLVAFCRGLPVLAEGTVLFAGARRWVFIRLAGPVAIANLVLAFGYSTLGAFAIEQDWLSIALGVSLAIPVIPLLVYWWRKREK